MSEQAIAQFLDLVAADESIEAALDAVAEQRADVASAAAELGKKRGLEFTGAEFASAVGAFYREHPGELDDAELAGVSGGFNPQPEPPGKGAGHTSTPWFAHRWASGFRGGH